MRIHAMRMSSLEPEENPGHQGCDACRWPFSLPWRRTEIPAHPVFTAALCRASRPTLSYIRSAACPKDRAGWWACPILVRATATDHLIEVGGLHIRDFYYPGALCLRSRASFRCAASERCGY